MTRSQMSNEMLVPGNTVCEETPISRKQEENYPPISSLSSGIRRHKTKILRDENPLQ